MLGVDRLYVALRGLFPCRCVASTSPHPPFSLLAAAALLAAFPGLRGLLALLCWAGVDAAGAAWAQLRQRPELLPAEGTLSAPLRQLLDAEGALDAATLAYLEHLLPPLPVLLLGLVAREGSELVRVRDGQRERWGGVRAAACAPLPALKRGTKERPKSSGAEARGA